jgi:curli biogenesis system outer membrane secretion channel CsgG
MVVARGLMLLSVLSLSGCTTFLPSMVAPEPVRYGPVPVATLTPADAALECLSRLPATHRAGVFAVHVISDQTNKFSQNTEGGFVPRDAAGMLVTALQKAGVPQVNRVDTAVTEWEMARAKEQVLGDGGPVTVGDQTVNFRPLLKGEIRGSDHVIDGSITQLDFNTYSGGGEAYIAGIGGGARTFAMTVAADLRVTNTKTTRIELAKSYSKQAVGTEVQGSVYQFFNNDLYDIDIGEKSQEGLDAGVRWMLADAAYDIVSSLIHNHSCDKYLPQVSQQLRAAAPTAALAVAREPPQMGSSRW